MRGIGVVSIVVALACLAFAVGFGLRKSSALDAERQAAYAGAEKAALEVATGPWAEVAKSMAICHSELGPAGIRKIVSIGNDDLDLCPNIVAVLRNLKLEWPEMEAKRIQLKRAYEAGFWRSASATVIADAKGEPLLALLLN